MLTREFRIHFVLFLALLHWTISEQRCVKTKKYIRVIYFMIPSSGLSFLSNCSLKVILSTPARSNSMPFKVFDNIFPFFRISCLPYFIYNYIFVKSPIDTFHYFISVINQFASNQLVGRAFKYVQIKKTKRNLNENCMAKMRPRARFVAIFSPN